MSSSSPRPWQAIRNLLRFDHAAIEEEVESGEAFYKGLDARALYTSSDDLHLIFSHPAVGGHWVDLGAGHGQSVLLYALMYPDRQSSGIEFSLARVRAGKKEKERLKIPNARLLQGDLLHCEIPDGDTYFLYFPTGAVLDRVLDELHRKKPNFKLVAIESHGDLLARLHKEAWLKPIASISLTTSRHHPEAIIFESRPAPFKIGPHQLSFREKILLIAEEEYQWLGESQGLEWLQDDQYQLAIPPRTVHWPQVQSVQDLDSFPFPLQQALKLRRLGELTLEGEFGSLKGELRKIACAPSFRVEISTGQWVEWNEIKRITQGERVCFERS